MNQTTGQDKKIRIKVNCIGPMLDLDGCLSSKSQNLIFATSGSGKSFLARGIRMLDTSAEDAKEHHLNPSNLVSEEGKIGTLAITEGNEEIAYLKLDTQTKSTEYRSEKYIFHVFSSDYVEIELKQKQFEPDGDISHEIIIGKENKEIDEKEEDLAKRTQDIEKMSAALKEEFEAKKSKLKQSLNINASLSEFRSLTVRSCYESTPKQDGIPNLESVMQQYKSFRDLPQDATAPKLPEIPTQIVDLDDLSLLLTTSVSSSTIAETVKQKISSEIDFFQTGLQLHQNDTTSCPFCTQSINKAAQEAIDTYVVYFEDVEAKTNSSLMRHRSALEQVTKQLNHFSAEYLRASNDYNKLKVSFPSIEKNELEAIDGEVAAITRLYEEIINKIDRKRKSLELCDFNIDKNAVTIHLEQVSSIHANNLGLIRQLSGLLENSDAERLRIQRQACDSYSNDFRLDKNDEFNGLLELSNTKNDLKNQIVELKKTSGDKVSARIKVADTFQELMTTMFGGRYTFDKDRFVVQRKRSDMLRGGDRTLSDGEKSVLAFCYFLAQCHLKVDNLQDYERLFFVIDDPVSSVSFDYVYSICQILKLLRINNGNLTFVGGNSPRPKLLLLTHHDYFYNVASTNNVINRDGLFQLMVKGTQHKINSQKGFVSPHTFHLQHVEAVANEHDAPTFGTPNSIRSVLETMWRFTRPDLPDLGTFLSYVTQELSLPLKSVLINDLSHGGKMSTESPLEEDIMTAAKETLAVVRILAPGQLTIIS